MITPTKLTQAVTVSRRSVLISGCISLVSVLSYPGTASAQQSGTSHSTTSPAAPGALAEAAEPACASCVGYVDGTLGSCSGVDVACSSSYDDRPAHFVAPWQYDGSTAAALQQLVKVLQASGASIEQQTADYVYAVLDGNSGPSLDLEFVFAPNDTTVALRAAQQAADTSRQYGAESTSAQPQLPFVHEAASLSNWISQLGGGNAPSQVLENIRLQLGWEIVPILRNRQRLFLFGESPFDSFGPVPPPVPDYSRDLQEF